MTARICDVSAGAHAHAACDRVQPGRAFHPTLDAARTLSVSADPTMATSIDLALRSTGCVHRSEQTVRGASATLATWKPHLLLLDIDLETGAGIRLVDAARAGARIGVIALTRRGDLRAELEAFERGADDFIRAPLVPSELVARAKAVLRRTGGVSGGLVPRLRVGDLAIDVLNRRVLVGEHELHLTSVEQALLYLLAANAGSVLTRDQILDVLWGSDFVIESNVVERHVRSLRAKLRDDYHQPRYIETLRGIGYRLRPSTGTGPAEARRPAPPLGYTPRSTGSPYPFALRGIPVGS